MKYSPLTQLPLEPEIFLNPKKRPEIMSKRKEEINGIQITSIVFNSVIIVSFKNLQKSSF